MRFRPAAVGLLAAVLGLLPMAAEAQPAPPARVAVRVGDHPGHGRLVFDWPAPPAFTQERQGDRLLLRFPQGRPVDLAGARRPPRNIAAVAQEEGAIGITLRPGARPRVFRLGNRVVVDALDPVPEAVAAPAGRSARPVVAGRPAGEGDAPLAARPGRARQASAPAARRAIASAPVAAPAALPPMAAMVSAPAVAEAPPPGPASPLVALPSPPTPTPPPPSPAPPVAAPSLPPPATALPVRLLTQPGQDRGILLPYPAGTGAALLRRGEAMLLAFDDATPLNLTALRHDPVFGGLEAEAVPGGMLLRLPLAAPAALRARREPSGWVVEAHRPAVLRDATTGNRAMVLAAEGSPASHLAIHAAQPTRVLAVADPESGMPLLLGLVAAAGQAMPVPRRLPELDLPVTLLGVAVLARADRVTLRAGADRFILGATGARLALDGAAALPAAAPAMTRAFDFPTLPPAQLLERVRSLQAGTAATPPLTRGPQRRAAAEALLALGLPQEAQAVIALGMAESPAAAADPVMRALSGAAALLAGRLAESAPLRDAALPETDELTLWRAALAAALGDSMAAAPGLAASLPLLLDYPAALRARLLPPVAFALAEAGATAPLQRLLAVAPPELDLGLAQAVLAEALGRPEEALAGYDRIAAGRDRQARARALRRAVELRLATGRIDPAAAARALEAALYAWRGDDEELAARLRLAELRRLAGDARGAMALLRETEPMFPEGAAPLRAGISEAFVAALEGEAPLTAVAMFDAYPEMLPPGERGEHVVVLLAGRLAALELNDRAAVLLRQATERASGLQRASLGLRLAALRLGEGDAEGTLAALGQSAVAGLPTPLRHSRAIIEARAEARRGRLAEAQALLRPLGANGQEPLSELLVEAQDWPGAAAALGAHLRESLPAAPEPLGEAQQRLVLRQAALLALAGDEAGVAALRGDYAPRLPEGPLASAFGALTVDPLRGLADLPRLQQELQLFRSLPLRLEALRAGAPLTR